MAFATLLKSSLLVALLLPGVLAGIVAWAWWAILARPALFLVLSLVALYCLSAFLVLRQFGQIGISGQRDLSPGNSAGELIQSAVMREAVFSLLFFFVASGVILLLLRWILSFARG